MDTILAIFIASSSAAAVSIIGIVPLVRRGKVPGAWIGWSDALAGGMMLGLAYLLTGVALSDGAGGAAGIFLGILLVFVTRSLIGPASLEPSPRSARQILLEGIVHSAAEGMAIAAAWVASPRFGLFMALAVAIHNIPEGTILASAQRERGAGLLRAAGLVVAGNLSQIVLAVAAWAVIASAPEAAAWIAGFAAGALVHLVLADLLPDAYRYSGATSIALVTAVAMGIVVFGGDALL